MQRSASAVARRLLPALALLGLMMSRSPAGLPGPADGEQPTTKPRASSSLEVLQVDLGDKAWGLNLLKIQVRNHDRRDRRLFVHIGGKPTSSMGRGFGMGEVYTIPAGKDHWLEHWYWIPPVHGTMNIRVKFTEPMDETNAYDEESFLVKADEQRYAIPNKLCNNLTSTEKLPVFKQFYGEVRHLEPFKAFASDHLVLYCSPDTPAFADAEAILRQRESALKSLCSFAGVTPKEKMIIFLFPDQPTKLMCTGHRGDGLARGREVFEVYNQQVKLDPYHELAHIVMAEIGSPPALLNEGFATYMQAEHRWEGKPVDQIGRELLGRRSLVPLAELLARQEIGSQPDDGKIAYPEAASFVGFLIESYGKEKFLSAYGTLKNGSGSGQTQRNISKLEDVYGQRLDQLEAKWHSRLK